MEFTKAQKAAIGSDGHSLLVSAAAGSGKTAVLVERVIRKICNTEHPVDVDKLLIVTFTNAAAAEMRQRLTKALREKIRQDPSEPLYRRQLQLLGRAQISTVHAACKMLIDRYFSYLSIEPSAAIGEESEMQLLFQNTLDDYIEELYRRQQTDEQMRNLISFFAPGRSDEEFRSALCCAYEYLMSQPFPQKAMYDMLPKEGETIRACFPQDALYHYIESNLRFLEKTAKHMMEECAKGPLLGSHMCQYFIDISSFFGNLLQLLEKDGYHGIYSFVSCNKPPRMPKFSMLKYKEYCKREDVTHPISPAEYEEMMEQFAVRWEPHMSRFKTMAEKIFTQDEDGHLQDMYWLNRYLTELFELVFALDERFAARKREKNVVSFADLERYALNLLVRLDQSGEVQRTDIANEIASQYEEIIVDEYQDTNAVQEMIFSALSRNQCNLFTVGDIKQSIYRFRGACPNLFLQRMEAAKEIKETVEELDDPSKLFLNQNFRSHPGVLAAVNDLFEQIMSKEVGQVEYDATQKLYPNDLYASDNDVHCEMHLLLRPTLTEMEDNHEIALLKALEQEAMFVAEEIQKLVGKQEIYDAKKGCRRLVAYQDIVIMSRSVQHVSSYFERELGRLGIPCINQSSDTNFLVSWEVQMVLAYLKVINNPYQDIPLVNLMYSDFFSFSASELAEIRALKKKVPFYEAVCLAAEKSAKVKNFLDTLEDMRRHSVGVHADALLSYIYNESGILYKVSAYPDGEARTAHLELFLQSARAFGKNSYKGLFAFVRYIDRLLSEEISPADSVGGETASAVQIMSIHKSKGLEFPICFLVNTERDILGRRNSDPVIFTNIGAACKMRDNHHFAEYEPLLLTIAKLREMQEDLSEAMRLLYVALTRAKVKLYVVAALDEKDAKEMLEDAVQQPENEAVDPLVLQQKPSFFRWMTYGWRHQVGMKALYDAFAVKLPSLSQNNVSAYLHHVKRKDYTVARGAVQNADTDAIDRVIRMIGKQYAYQEETEIPAKMSVSEVKGMREKDEEAVPLLQSNPSVRRPKFVSETKADGKDVGNAVHKFMQFSDFALLSQSGGIEKEKERLLALDFFSEREMEQVDFSLVSRFVTHPVFALLLDADRMVREQRFMFALPADKVLQGVKSDKEILLQGVLDCMYCKDGQWTILDYKTDRLKNEEDFLERYELQLALYAVAAEQQWGIKIDRLLIYSFHLNKIIEIDAKKTLAF